MGISTLHRKLRLTSRGQILLQQLYYQLLNPQNPWEFFIWKSTRCFPLLPPLFVGHVSLWQFQKCWFLGVLCLASFPYIFSEINYPDPSQKAQCFRPPSGHLHQVSHGHRKLNLSPNQTHPFSLVPILGFFLLCSQFWSMGLLLPPPNYQTGNIEIISKFSLSLTLYV